MVKAADDETVADVQTSAESGELKNWLDGEYQSRGKIDVLGVSTPMSPEYRAGNELSGNEAGNG